MAGRYRALLIGNSNYPADEHNLAPLKGPANDVGAVRRALVDTNTGLFADTDVTTVTEATSPEALRAMGRFFTSAERHDVLLLYFSGHGKLDLSGRLHLCMHDTDSTDLLSTAVSSTRINEFVETSRARNMVIVLDCCYAGAFRGGEFGDAIAGPGRYVLTSCRGTQLANDATVDNGISYFTEHLVEGLLGAAVDRDGDGLVDFSDVYTYVDRRLRDEGKQIPQRRVQGDGDLPLARRSAAITPAEALARATPDGEHLAHRSRRNNIVGISAAVVVLAGVAIFALNRAGAGHGGGAPSATGHPRSAPYTSIGPFRLIVFDSASDPFGGGCEVTLTDLATRETTSVISGVYETPATAQVALTGRLRWTVNDSRCAVNILRGPGSLSLPKTLSPSVGDSDAFTAPRHVRILVTDFHGDQQCNLQLVDPTTGTPTDRKSATKAQREVLLEPFGARTVYLEQHGCGVHISAG